MALSKRLSRICLAVLCLFPAFSSESVFAADKSNATEGAAWYDNAGGWNDAQKKAYDNYAANKGLPTSDKLASGEAKLSGDQISWIQKDVGVGADGKIGNVTLDAISKWSASGGGSSGGSSSNGTLNTAGTIADPGWMFGASTFSPSQKRYTQGPKENLRVVLKTVSDILLVAISALAVLLIAVAGFRMAVSAGNSDEASKGKAMVRYNILAIVVSLMAYTLIEFVSWIVRAS